MDIVSNGKIFSDRQIIGFVNLLGTDYRPRRIIIYESRLDIIRFYPRCFNFSFEELLGKLEGTYDESNDTAYICVFAQNDDGDDVHSKQLYSLHALAHELRHRYQALKGLYADDDEMSEVDADRFATNFINRNSYNISKIMGWKEEWTVEEGD
ncbi:MAG: hypothetical protein ACOY46_07755 [Bacillota bacterium]